MVPLRYGGGQRGRLGLQVAKTQGQRERESERVRDRERSGQEEEEDEEEARDEGGRLDRKEILGALRKEAHLRKIRERQIPVLVQHRGQVGKVKREGEKQVLRLLETLFARRKQEGLFFEQRGLAVGPGLPTPAALPVFGGADRRGALPGGVFSPTPEFVGNDRSGGERQLVVQVRALGCVCG